MSRLLAAELATLAVQRVEDVAVADVGGDDADAVVVHQPVEAEVGHHRDRDEVDAEREREHRQQLVAVERRAGGVDGEHAVAVAVEGEAEVEAMLSRLRARAWLGRSLRSRR